MATDDYAINDAIFTIAHHHGLRNAGLAGLLYASVETVNYWSRKRATRAPKMALALLCFKLGLPPHPLLR